LGQINGTTDAHILSAISTFVWFLLLGEFCGFGTAIELLIHCTNGHIMHICVAFGDLTSTSTVHLSSSLGFFHLFAVKTGPSMADIAWGRLNQGTKLLAEGGFDKVFKQSFETIPGEELRKTYACYLSTSAGPVAGTLYISTKKIAFCSDLPLSYKTEAGKTDSAYYKVRGT
jgi:hypothetical protein